MNNQASRWIKSTSRQGRTRTFETIAIFAINNAYAEQRPFTVLNHSGSGVPQSVNYK